MKPYSILNPGSDEAVAAGCTCPTTEAVVFSDSVLYWTDSECPLHGVDTDVGESDES